MRLILLIVLLLLMAVAGYAWKTNPDGCRKLGVDFVAVFQPPAGTSTAPADASADTGSSNSAPSMPAASAPVPAPATPAPAAPAPAAQAPAAPLWHSAANWHAPDVIPAQPNWSWTTIGGKTYQNVVITKIEADTVSITHSMGVDHLAINTLPADIQKQLGYDPAAANAMTKETERENEHPYYPLAAVADAQAAARQLQWPLAWICTDLSELSYPNPALNTTADLTQMAMAHLKNRAVIIFVDGNGDLSKLTWPVVREQQFFKYDDGTVPGGHHFVGPKIVFTDPDITQPLGRATYTEMFTAREAAIDAVLDAINKGILAPVPVAPAAPPRP